MTATTRLYRLSAFAENPSGGNPAGVWVGPTLPEAATMQQVAAEVGYSETAFLAPETGFERQIRYFSPVAEVPFCGHATIAAGVLLGQIDGPGDYRLESAAGTIGLCVRQDNGRVEATLTSVEPAHKPVPQDVLQAALEALCWEVSELDEAIPAALAYAGAWHLVIAAATRERLAKLDYDFDALQALMLANGLTTLQLIWRESDTVFLSRNPFPVGGVVEDAATGAAAAALGGYLRDAEFVTAPFAFDIRQGEFMGRPSDLKVNVPVTGGISVTGTATTISQEQR